MNIVSIDSPRVTDIPEVLQRSTVLIYGAVRGAQTPLTGFPCEIFIFDSANAGKFKQLVDNNGLVRFSQAGLSMSSKRLCMVMVTEYLRKRWRDDLSNSVGRHVLLLSIILFAQKPNFWMR